MIEGQIKKLNEETKCCLGVSSIHGVGVFALRDIEMGEKCYCTSSERRWCQLPKEKFDELRPEIRELIIAHWPIALKGDKFLFPNDEVWLLSFMNHSDNPNYNPLLDVARRDIKVGEEITEDYNEI